MSLINQVLLDLDQRRATTTASPASARAASAARRPDRSRAFAGAIGAAVLAVAAGTAVTQPWRPAEPAAAGASALAVSTRPANAIRPSTEGTNGAAIAAAAERTTPPPTTASTDFVWTPHSDAGQEATIDLAARAVGTAPPTDAARPASPAAPPAAAPLVALAPSTAAMALATRENVRRGDVVASIVAPTPTPTPTPLPVRLEKSTPPLAPAERAEAEYRRGVELHERGQASEAEAAFAAALQLDGRYAAARRALAVQWIGHGRDADAERLLREGLANDPRQPALAIVVARIEAERRDVRAAIETLRASLGGNAGRPEQAEAQALMATLQQGLGAHREAIDAYAAALRQSPQNGAWWIGLGLSLAAEGRPESAREALERARATGTLAPELQIYVEQRLRSLAP